MILIFGSLYIIVLLVVFIISTFVVYHLLKYSVSKKSAYLHIGIYLVVLLLLLLLNVYSFTNIEIPEFTNTITPQRF